MKKVIKNLTYVLPLLLCSCEDFLTQEAQDLVIPTTVAQYKEILQGDGYFKSLQSNLFWTEFLTDNMTIDGTGSTKPSPMLDTYREIYQWQAEIENDQWSDPLYAYLATQALPATVCLEDLDKMTGTETEREILRGQASFHRALAYFYLANFYGPAYNEAKSSDPCIPMTLTATVSPGSYPRKSVGEVWGQIRKDAETAVEALEGKSIPTTFEINYKAALLLAARVALFMEDYDAAIKYGEKLIEQQAPLYDLTASITADDYISPYSTQYEGIIDSNEKLFTFGGSDILGIWLVDVSTLQVSMTFCVSNENGLLSLYDRTNDLRFAYYFVDPDPSAMTMMMWPAKTVAYQPGKHTESNIYYSMSMRSAEIYLTLAEAYARKDSPENDRALGYLNTLLRNRILNYTDLTAADFSSQEALVEKIWEERRKELCFEEAHRWWDMRRCGQKGFTRKWLDGDYVIADKDPAFTLNFPKTERDFDPGLGSNVRPERNAISNE